MKSITIVSPCYNEEDNVATCHETVKDIFERELPGYKRQHVFVDNCSTDATVDVLKDIAAKDPSVSIVVNARNFGAFRAVMCDSTTCVPLSPVSSLSRLSVLRILPVSTQ